MHYDLPVVVPVAFLALHDGAIHGQVLLELLQGKLLQVVTHGFCNNSTASTVLVSLGIKVPNTPTSTHLMAALVL